MGEIEAARPVVRFEPRFEPRACLGHGTLARSLKIELLCLPTYSPNLNLIERVWKFVKKQCLGTRVLSTYEEFTAAIDDCLNKLPTTHKAQMDTLLTLKFQTFENVPVLSA